MTAEAIYILGLALALIAGVGAILLAWDYEVHADEAIAGRVNPGRVHPGLGSSSQNGLVRRGASGADLSSIPMALSLDAPSRSGGWAFASVPAAPKTERREA